MRNNTSTAYASPASKCDASSENTSARSMRGTFGMLASLHVLPPSRVTLIKPLLVPTQINPGVTVESAIDSIAALPAGAPPRPAGGGGASLRIVWWSEVAASGLQSQSDV